MGVNADNGRSSRGTPPPPSRTTTRAPRRLVLLGDGEQSAVQQVLLEYQGEEVTGDRFHEDLQGFADQHRGRHVAGEWLGPLGWTRFLWCRK